MRALSSLFRRQVRNERPRARALGPDVRAELIRASRLPERCRRRRASRARPASAARGRSAGSAVRRRRAACLPASRSAMRRTSGDGCSRTTVAGPVGHGLAISMSLAKPACDSARGTRGDPIQRVAVDTINAGLAIGSRCSGSDTEKHFNVAARRTRRALDVAGQRYNRRRAAARSVRPSRRTASCPIPPIARVPPTMRSSAATTTYRIRARRILHGIPTGSRRSQRCSDSMSHR
jgi:hypothetical protein